MASSVKRKNAFFLDFDTTNWLAKYNKKVDDFNGKGGAFERAVGRIIPMVEQDFKSFMANHTKTGATIEALMDAPNLYWGDESFYRKLGKKKSTKGSEGEPSKNILFVEFGFKIGDGGLPAVFLDIGRPGIKYKNGTVSKEMKPSFFVYYAIERNMSKFNQIFKEEVMKELGDLL